MNTKPIFRVAEIKIEIETRNPSLNLLECAVAVKQCRYQTREAVADLVRSYDYAAHVGGHHVGIMNGIQRLAIITSNTPDFN